MKYPRYLKNSLLQAFKVSPVTLLIGPRQTGKTTLMREIGEELGMHYLTFDTLKQLAAAQEDPEGFIGALSKPVIIDEVQRVPQIALPIKLAVDQERVPGSFGLTGSANPLVAPKLNDSLAGRMFILHMWPLSMSEIQRKQSQFLELVFDPTTVFSEGTHWNRKDMIEVFTAGGYPDALALDSIMRDRWYDNLLTTILERDVQDIANISRPRDIAKLLNILAARTSNLLNLSELSRVSSIPYTTLNHYMVLLESLFLIIRQPAWHLNRTKRLIKMPKIYFGDTGLLINQLRIGSEVILENGRLLGPILENFVFLELKKLSTWSLYPVEFYHYRTQTGIEVDIVLENRAGQIVGIEIKSSETISGEDWKGLDILGEEMGDKMIRGIILYPGKEVVAFRKNRIAIPLSTLWGFS
ncbi:MAG TPA: ATP-binding protein [Rhabdochlamydiaceae bacterium]|nr:ATP-binding protein [Rhabdochlamydiaceae bacterium]